MDRFEYLSVLVSIIIAFGASEVIAAWGERIRRPERMQPFWIHTAWTGLVMLMLIQLWWGFWQYNAVVDWNFFSLSMVVAETLVLVLVAHVLSPRAEPGEVVDMRAFFFDRRRHVFGLAATALLLLTVTDITVIDLPLLHSENLVRTGGMALCAALAFSDSERVHGAAICVGYALFAVFLAVAFPGR